MKQTNELSVSDVSSTEIERVFRMEYGRAVAVLVRSFGDIDIAEEAVQDAFTTAVQKWPSIGLPPSPRDGSSPQRVTARSTVSAARRPGRTGMPRRPYYMGVMNQPSRRMRCRTTGCD
jgi:predicted RNA polymerase sigma factor